MWDFVKSKFYSRFDYKTEQKIIVFESDDWGGIRMPSKKSIDNLKSFGLLVDNDAFNLFDTLENVDDLNYLYEVLENFKDVDNNSPVFTTNTIVCNPNFEKIKNDNFRNYYYENIRETYNSYNNGDVISKFLEGYQNKLIMPQFHGREHLNVSLWLDFLNKGSNEVHIAFQNQLFGISTTITSEKRKSYLEGFAFNNTNDRVFVENAIQEGASIFKDIFNFTSESIIAPNYNWHPILEATFNQVGVKFIQGSRKQLYYENNNLKSKINYTGRSNRFHQIFSVRNAIFEPSIYPNRRSALDICLNGIDKAFKMNNAAIISTHRINYVSGIDERNRNQNLLILEDLLNTILRRWPNVKFMNSVEFGNYIK